MTTYTVYADTNDHEVRSSNATYSTARSGGTLSDDTANDQWDAAQYLNAGTYYCFECFLSFDTSAIPVGTPASIKLKQTVGTIISAPTQTINYAEHAWSGGTADWIAGASLPTAQYAISVPNNTAAGTTLTSTSAPADVTRSTAYKLVGYSALLKSGTAPTGTSVSRLRTANYAGTSSDPTLVVVIATPYTLTGAAGSFTLTGQSAGLTYGRPMAAAAGAFAMTGVDAGLSALRSIRAAVGEFIITGQSVMGHIVMRAATAAFALTGIAALMGIRRFPPVERIINFANSRLDPNRTLEL